MEVFYKFAKALALNTDAQAKNVSGVIYKICRILRSFNTSWVLDA